MKVSIKNCLVEVELEGTEMYHLTERAKEVGESLEGYICALLLEI
jgi:hypothetical protein